MLLTSHIKLFDACIKPIAMYNPEVWIFYILGVGRNHIEKQYLSLIPEKVHIKYLKYILGVNRAAVNSAVKAELGRFPLALFGLKATIGFWLHTQIDNFLIN